MLWDLVYEFFVKYVFGGQLTGNSIYGGLLGVFYNIDDLEDIYIEDVNTAMVGIKSPLSGAFGSQYFMSLGNYLSLIATIITMVAILLFCVFIIKKIIAIIFRLFNGGNVF